MIKLSVLDQSPISDGSTAPKLFHIQLRLHKKLKTRIHTFWVSEHHNSVSLAGSSPEILISHIAAKTDRIRVGSGGVMLPHYSPYKVAENFRVLEALYPNRIDLGVGRAPGGMPIATRALQEGKMVSLDRYPEQIADVAMYLHDQVPENHHYATLKATQLSQRLLKCGCSVLAERVLKLLQTTELLSHLHNLLTASEALKL